MKRILPLALLFTAWVIPAFEFSPGSEVKVLETRYFDIIYSEGTAPSAYRLAEEADAIYERITGLLSVEPDERIPVVITDLESDSNGFTSLYPYTKIVLYDVPPEPESSIGNNRDYLLSLFTHELTHAVSLNIRGGLWRALRPVLGDFYTAPNNIWMMPMHMVEGVTVSFESMDGYGRLNDPFIRQYLLQAALDGEFLDPDDASGALDRFPFASSYYYYGGFFSRYLQDTYGMETYARLWKEAGDGLLIPGFSGAFKRVYGRDLKDEWAAFAEGFSPPADTHGIPDLLVDKADYIVDCAGYEEKIYYVSVYTGMLCVYNIDTGKSRALLELDNPSAAGVDVSPDGSLLVLGLLENTESGTERVVRFYDPDRNVFTGEVVPGVRDARFVSKGISGVVFEGGSTSLVLYRDGETETLLEGSAEVVFGPSGELEPGLYVFLANVNGKRDIYTCDTRDNSVNRIVLPIEGEFFPRSLAVRDGRILFSFNNDDSFYRLGMIDGERFFYQDRTVSGGVFEPHVFDDRVYYTGLFSDGWYLAEHPDRFASLSPGGSVSFVPADAFSGPGEYLPEETPGTGEVAASYRASRYLSPRFVLPYIASGTITYEPGSGLDVSGFSSFGLKTYGCDPAEGNEWSAYGGYVWRNPFAEAGFQWMNSTLPVSLSVGGNDILQYSEETGYAYRRTAVSAGASFNRNDPVSGVRVRCSGGGEATFSAPGTLNSSPYGWRYTDQSYSANLYTQAGFTGRKRTDLSAELLGFFYGYGDIAGVQTFSRYIRTSLSADRSFPGYFSVSGGAGALLDFDPSSSLELNLSANLGNLHSLFPGFIDYAGARLYGYVDYRCTDGLWKTEGKLYVAPPWIPIIVRLYGAFSPGYIFSTDGGEDLQTSTRYPVFSEFSDRGPVSRFYAGGDLEAGLFNIEVNGRAWFLPLYINRINMSGGYRAAFNGGPYYHSVFARLGLTFSPLVGVYSRYHLSLRLECAYSVTDNQFIFSLF